MPSKKREYGPDPLTWGRVLHLVRHGQYLPNDKGGSLTPLGHRQARRTGKHLAQWPISAIYSSDYGRAIQTAEEIRGQLGDVPHRKARILREIQPTAIPGWKVPLEKRAEGRLAAEQVQKRFLKASRKPRHEVLVCHGNLIRFLMCQLLGAPDTAWMRLGTHHCGITQLVVVDTQSILLQYNSATHLRPTQRTCR